MSLLAPPEPRILVLPESGSSAGREAIDLARLAGLELDPWEAFVLEHALAEGDDKRWAAVEVGLCVPRQNGKGAILEARELAALFLFGEELVIHSAQQFKTSKEHFLRVLGLIEGTPELERRLKRVIRTHGEEGLILKGGQRLLFFARNKSAGRGFSKASLVVFDEAQFLAEVAIGAIVPTQATVANRQRWYVGSAVDQLVHADGLVFARVRDRALRDDDPRLAFFEWSLPGFETPDELDAATIADEEAWARANPGLEIRIPLEAVHDELRSMSARTFAVERLGVGDWPSPEAVSAVIDLERWAELTDLDSTLLDPVAFAFDVSPDRSSAAIAAAGRRKDGLFHVEIVAHKRGTGWIIPELAALRERWRPLAVVCDGIGPAGALVHRFQGTRLRVVTVNATEHARACGQLLDLVESGGLRHLGSGELVEALRGAARRPLGDSWAWSRKNASVDISPLVAATLALWGTATRGRDPHGQGPTIL